MKTKYLKGVIKTIPKYIKHEVPSTLPPRMEIGAQELQYRITDMGNRKERRQKAAEIRKHG
jgi:hypothetical protein